jgi:hypothetical protein
VSDLKQNLQTISGIPTDEANIANGRTLMLRHNARKSKPDTTTITTDNFFKIANVNKSILFIESFEILHVLMEDYVKPNEPIGMIAIHPQGSGPNRQQIIGGFYKMYFTKYNQTFAILKRQEPYIHVLQPTTFQPLSAEEIYNRIHLIITGQTVGGAKIHIGKRGGRYIVVKGKKKYIQ